MLKALIIFALIIYVFYKASGLIMRFLMKIAGQKIYKHAQKQQRGFYNNGQNGHNTQRKRYKPNGSNVYVEYGPENGKSSKQSDSKHYDGGEYIDFEEVK